MEGEILAQLVDIENALKLIGVIVAVIGMVALILLGIIGTRR